MGSDIVGLLRSNNKATSDTVLLSKSQAESVEGLKTNSEAYLRAYSDLTGLAQKKAGKTKESAEGFVRFYFN